MKRLTLLLVLMLLPAQALAECAWVLYVKYFIAQNPPVQTPYEIDSAYPTHRECEKHADKSMKIFQEMFQLLDEQNREVWLKKTGIPKYECFPDTIDPRGKGGER